MHLLPLVLIAGELSLIGFLYLIVKLVILGLVFYGLQWVCTFLGVTLPDIIWKILAVILVLIGIIMVLVYLGVN